MADTHRYGYEESPRLEPSPLYAELRAREPVARVNPPYGDDGWLVTRYESVKKVLHDPRFSRAAAVEINDRLPRASAHVPKANLLSRFDPPEHSRLRQLIAGAFTRHKAEQYRPRTREIADELIDELCSAGPPADIIAGYAKRLPMLSLAEILGVPPADTVQVKEWTAPIVTRRGHTAQEIAAAHTRLEEYLAGLLAHRRAQPGEDFLSVLVRSQQRRQRYTDHELVLLVASLLINDSVASHLAMDLYLLLTHPTELAWLRANPERVPQAVEELLRFGTLFQDAPNSGQGNSRRAVADVELDGVVIRAGEWVLPSITSANRDEQAFSNADQLDFTRPRNRHLSFGFGTHHCPAAPLSRMQLQVAIGTLLTRLPGLALAVAEPELTWKTGHLTRGPEKLPVTW